MNAEALARRGRAGEAHFWSRSRGRLWKKGETSGNVLRVVEMRIDCDQDAVWLIVDPAGPACHTGARSCFYRRIEGDAAGARGVRRCGCDRACCCSRGAGRHSDGASLAPAREFAWARSGGDPGGRRSADPDDTDITGLYARESDRVCVVPARRRRTGSACSSIMATSRAAAASGTATRTARRCTSTSARRPDAVSTRGSTATASCFPARLPDACQTACSGRASLAGLTVERLSESASEAATLRDAAGGCCAARELA